METEKSRYGQPEIIGDWRYYDSIYRVRRTTVTMSLFYTVFEIFNVEYWHAVWNLGFGSSKVIENAGRMVPIAEFLFVFHCNYDYLVQYSFRDKAILVENCDFSYHLLPHTNPWGSGCKYFRAEPSQILGLPSGVDRLREESCVYAQYTRVIDRHTDVHGRTDGKVISMAQCLIIT